MNNYEYQIVCHIVAARAVKVAATAHFIAQDLALRYTDPDTRMGLYAGNWIVMALQNGRCPA